MRLRCLIIDDHPLMRGALRNALEALFDGLHCELAHSIDEGLNQLKAHANHPFNLILLDLSLPDAVGTSGLEAIHQRFPAIPVLVVSAIQDRNTMERCFTQGALGFLPKTASTDKLNTAIRAILSGQTYIPPDLDDGYDRVRAKILAAQSAHTSDPRQLGLTDRQAAVLHLIVQGFPNKLISRKLELAEGTVKVHVSAVLRALGVRNRTQAALAANRLGLRWRDV
jgi:DNA-binding NarL/FixJ family response regulator